MQDPFQAARMPRRGSLFKGKLHREDWQLCLLAVSALELLSVVSSPKFGVQTPKFGGPSHELPWFVSQFIKTRGPSQATNPAQHPSNSPQPDDSTTRRLDDSTTRRLDDSTTRRLDDSTTRRLDDSTTRRLDDSTTRRLDDSTPAPCSSEPGCRGGAAAARGSAPASPPPAPRSAPRGSAAPPEAPVGLRERRPKREANEIIVKYLCMCTCSDVSFWWILD